MRTITLIDLSGKNVLEIDSNGCILTSLQVGGNLVSSTNPIPVEIKTLTTVLRAAVSVSSSGDNSLVAASTGKKTKVLGLVLVASGDVDIIIKSADTRITGGISLALDGNGFVLPMATPGMHWLETAANEALNLNLSAAVQVSGFIVYEQSA